MDGMKITRVVKEWLSLLQKMEMGISESSVTEEEIINEMRCWKVIILILE